MERWVGKVAIVTGASSGLGAAIAQILVENGLKVIGLARRVERVEELAVSLANQPGQLFPVACDITIEENILEAFKWTLENVGPVHILINNAGLTAPTTLTDGSTELWRQVFEVNCIALCICTREAVKIMTEHNIQGHIIHINSIAGHHVPALANMNVYPASKFAVTALTESLRVELRANKSKIKITSISPGVVRTEFAQGFPDDGTKEALLEMPALQAMDIAKVVLFVLETPPHVQVHEMIVRSVGEMF